MSLPRKLTAELIGTFFLVFAVCMAAGSGQPLAALGIGAMLTAMVFAGGHVSGAHYNPAVSTAAVLRGAMARREYVPYIAAQLVGGAAAGLLVKALGYDPESAMKVASTGNVLVVEFLLTFALAYVVLNCATARGNEGNSFYGLAIGFTVIAGAISVGSVSGGAFNPAVAVGAALDGLLAAGNIWMYVVATMAGGAVAAAAFNFINAAEKPHGDLHAAETGFEPDFEMAG